MKHSYLSKSSELIINHIFMTRNDFVMNGYSFKLEKESSITSHGEMSLNNVSIEVTNHKSQSKNNFITLSDINNFLNDILHDLDKNNIDITGLLNVISTLKRPYYDDIEEDFFENFSCEDSITEYYYHFNLSRKIKFEDQIYKGYDFNCYFANLVLNNKELFKTKALHECNNRDLTRELILDVMHVSKNINNISLRTRSFHEILNTYDGRSHEYNNLRDRLLNLIKYVVFYYDSNFCEMSYFEMKAYDESVKLTREIINEKED